MLHDGSLFRAYGTLMSGSKGRKQSKPERAKANPWRGPLTPASAAEGINAAYRNAYRLLNDALKLFMMGSFPSAASLAVLAIEECGKPDIIHRILIAKTDRARQKHWREYTTHTAKNASWIVPSLLKAAAKTLNDFRIVFDETLVHRFMLDDFKQWGLYTECRGINWSEPASTITSEICRQIVDGAMALLSRAKVFTAEQMQCYFKHLSPVIAEIAEDADTNAVREAMKNYIVECQQRGWVSSDVDPTVFFVSKPAPVRSGEETET